MTCSNCQGSFTPTHHLQKRFCGDECRNAYWNVRTNGKARQTRLEQRREYVCRCGKTFLSARSNARHCSNACRSISNNERRNPNTPEYKRWYLYKLTPERYDAMAEQGCRVCGSKDDLRVDHDHSCCPGQKTCGQCVRGLLCHPHNIGEGSFTQDEYFKMECYLMETKDVVGMFEEPTQLTA